MTHPLSYDRKRLLHLLFVLVCLSGATGCSTTHMYQVGGLLQGNYPVTEWKAQTLNTFFWGAVRQDLPVDNCQLGDGTRIGIEEVKIEKKFGHALATFLTLGIWNPVKISWRCAKPAPVDGILD